MKTKTANSTSDGARYARPIASDLRSRPVHRITSAHRTERARRAEAASSGRAGRAFLQTPFRLPTRRDRAPSAGGVDALRDRDGVAGRPRAREYRVFRVGAGLRCRVALRSRGASLSERAREPVRSGRGVPLDAALGRQRSWDPALRQGARAGWPGRARSRAPICKAVQVVPGRFAGVSLLPATHFADQALRGARPWGGDVCHGQTRAKGTSEVGADRELRHRGLITRSGWRESDPHFNLGGGACFHYNTPAGREPVVIRSLTVTVRANDIALVCLQKKFGRSKTT